MREFKLRCWNTTTGEMQEVESIDFNHGKVEQVNTDNDRILFPDKECVLMHYTGLKDRHGVEIYEGDIVKLHYFYQSLGANMGVIESEEEITGEVFHDEFGWAVTKMRGRHWEDLTGYEAGEGKSYIAHLYNMDGQTHEESFEVIGNIYENPELLP